MGINNAHYYGWEGKLHSPWWATLAIVRVALLQVFRRKSYWLVIATGDFSVPDVLGHHLRADAGPAAGRCAARHVRVVRLQPHVPSRARRTATSASCSSRAWW